MQTYELSNYILDMVIMYSAITSVSHATMNFHSSAMLDYNFPELLYQMQFLIIKLFKTIWITQLQTSSQS